MVLFLKSSQSPKTSAAPVQIPTLEVFHTVWSSNAGTRQKRSRGETQIGGVEMPLETLSSGSLWAALVVFVMTMITSCLTLRYLNSFSLHLLVVFLPLCSFLCGYLFSIWHWPFQVCWLLLLAIVNENENPVFFLCISLNCKEQSSGLRVLAFFLSLSWKSNLCTTSRNTFVQGDFLFQKLVEN